MSSVQTRSIQTEGKTGFVVKFHKKEGERESGIEDKSRETTTGKLN
jgi:hypothetical protein